MSSNSTNHPVQGEAAFTKLTETVRVSLQTFNAIRTIPSTGTVSSPLCLAVTELTNAAVCEISLFYRLLFWLLNQVSFAQYPAFNSHPLFLELAPAVHSAVDKFYKEYKDSKSPTTALILAGLEARAKEVIASSTKRSSYPLFPLRKFHRAFRIAIADAADAPTGSRPEKVKKTKNLVRL